MRLDKKRKIGDDHAEDNCDADEPAKNAHYALMVFAVHRDHTSIVEVFRAK